MCMFNIHHPRRCDNGWSSGFQFERGAVNTTAKEIDIKPFVRGGQSFLHLGHHMPTCMSFNDETLIFGIRGSSVSVVISLRAGRSGV